MLISAVVGKSTNQPRSDLQGYSRGGAQREYPYKLPVATDFFIKLRLIVD